MSMNKDQSSGRVKQAKSKIKEFAGKLASIPIPLLRAAVLIAHVREDMHVPLKV